MPLNKDRLYKVTITDENEDRVGVYIVNESSVTHAIMDCLGVFVKKPTTYSKSSISVEAFELDLTIENIETADVKTMADYYIK